VGSIPTAVSEVRLMSKPNSEKRTPTALRLPDSLRERVQAVAEERGTSFNHLVIKALELYLEALPPLEVSVDDLRQRMRAS
jgi:predicted DNA-binding protein